MSFAKKVGVVTEYQGESFTRSLYREDNTTWDAVHGGTFEMFNTAGVVVADGTLIKSGDDLSLTFKVTKTQTVNLVGEHLLLAHLPDSGDVEFDDVIA